MTLYRAVVFDTPTNPFDAASSGALRSEQDGGLVVTDGQIVARGPFEQVRAEHPDEELVDLRDGILVPGFVDTHVHFPQVRVIGGLGLPLLDWLDRYALPEEARLADASKAGEVAAEFLDGLIGAGTTSALVFGAHFHDAVDVFFTQAEQSGLRIAAGLVVSDRLLRPELLTDPQRAYEESMDLARRWHGVGRLRYAVTPRFALSTGEELMESCAQVMRDAPGVLFTSHVNENPAEIEEVARLTGAASYTDAYDRHGLVSPASVLAHNVHPTDHELAVLADRDGAVAHCPTSNAALGSGLFPMRRHLEAGVRIALGCDVGAGTGFSLVKEGLQAYFGQRLQPDGLLLTPAHLLYLATSAGAHALGLEAQVGDLSAGKRFDAVWLRPLPGDPLAVGLTHAEDPMEALAKVFALATPSDVAAVWIDGTPVRTAA